MLLPALPLPSLFQRVMSPFQSLSNARNTKDCHKKPDQGMPSSARHILFADRVQASYYKVLSSSLMLIYNVLTSQGCIAQ